MAEINYDYCVQRNKEYIRAPNLDTYNKREKHYTNYVLQYKFWPLIINMIYSLYTISWEVKEGSYILKE